MAIQNKLSAADYKKILDESSGQTRNLMVVFIPILLFMMVTAASTSHIQLFVPDSKLPLPLINVEVSVVDFYIIAPFIFLMFHLDLLLNLLKHAEKFKAWVKRTAKESDKKIEETEVPDEILYQFVFNYYHSGSQPWTLNIGIMLVTWLVAFCAPLFVLAQVQYMFLPYHGKWITLWHQCLVCLDAAALSIYWIKIRRPGWKWPQLVKLEPQTVIPEFFLYIPSLMFVFMVCFFCLSLAVIPDSREDSGMVKMLNEVTNGRVGLKRNLDLEMEIAQGKVNVGAGADFSYRDLRFANLGRVYLRGANLMGANLEGANLSESNLSGANLSYAYMDDIILYRARLEGAKLSSIHLINGYFDEVDLTGADLSDAMLDMSEFYRTNLSGTNLSGIHLEGAIFDLEELEGAYIYGAYIRGARIYFPDSAMVEHVSVERSGYCDANNVPDAYTRNLQPEVNYGVSYDRVVGKYGLKYKLEKICDKDWKAPKYRSNNRTEYMN
ncbi:MAG: pentapeptide repeat-containing protein, partial [Nitrospinota bacterium]|nr:pentapeptide repeat-containing protein [Nitrospinota bacterium]